MLAGELEKYVFESGPPDRERIEVNEAGVGQMAELAECAARVGGIQSHPVAFTNRRAGDAGQLIKNRVGRQRPAQLKLERCLLEILINQTQQVLREKKGDIDSLCQLLTQKIATPKPDDKQQGWECPTCTFVNSNSSSNCEVCDTLKST